MYEDNKEQEQNNLVVTPNELLFTLGRFIKMYQRESYRNKPPHVPHRGQIRVLHLIAVNEGLTHKDLAELLDIRSPSMSELLDKLERLNLIRREKDTADKRITHVYLSPDGWELVRSSQNQVDFSETLFGCLSEEERYLFYTVIKKICAGLEAETILEGDDEPLPPHLREGHRPPPPPEGDPLPPHLSHGHRPSTPPLAGEPLHPHKNDTDD